MPVFESLQLVDLSGYVIIAVIVAMLALCLVLTAAIRGRYAQIEQDLTQNQGSGAFHQAVLRRVTSDARQAHASGVSDVGAQVLVERAIYAELGPLLVGERLVRASTGLMIILGLVGTFYGLTASIGKLVLLVSAAPSGADDLAQSLTQALTQALSGMTVAFTTSLAGVLGAVVMTVVGIFASIADRRAALTVSIEAYLGTLAAPPAAREVRGNGAQPPTGLAHVQLHPDALASLAGSVVRLEATVQRFESSLDAFASSTRDFREFNAHLKDNIQRMSLGFAELSDTLQSQVDILRPRVRS